MRIAIIGQSAFGQATLEALIAVGAYEIVGVFASPDTGRAADPLASAARERQIPLWQFKRMRDAECVRTFESLNADLCVMAYVTDIVPMSIIESPESGTIQYHPSLLPLHRGPSSINWAIINGDRETGLTIFWPDAGLDTGPVLMQRSVEIGADDTVGSLYFQRLFPMGVDALAESVELVANGTAPRIKQDEDLATYEGWCGDADGRIDWEFSVCKLHNLIRGCDPRPGAWAQWKDERVRMFGSRISSTGTPPSSRGTVVGVDDSGIEVAASDGTLRLARLQVGGGRKVAGAETGIKVGDRFT